ncbi:MAG TPA: efflux RND transporter periplasmic adaptor subunit [Geminicoccaceae bacterium]|nr:efflux RND transporter periplasmic adaptor subunit [Geminicoccaceae bacterium]
MTRSIRAGGWARFCGCALLLSLTGCDEQAASRTAPAPPQVTVAEVTQGPVPIVMRFSGTVQAVKTVQIIPRVSGYIEKRSFVEGAEVKTGDSLYEIDPRPFQATLDQLKAQLAVNQANLAYWTGEAKRYGDAVKSGAVSTQQYEEAVTKQQEAQASVEQTQAEIVNAQLNLSFTDITAPFDGRIQQTRMYEGDLVDAYQDTLTTLVQIDPVYVIFNVTRRELFEIQAMQVQGLVGKLEDSATIELTLPDGGAYGQKGKLDFISSQIDTTTDTLTFRAVIANAFSHSSEGDLVPGQYVPVRMILGERPDALLVPKPALLENQAGQQVYVVDKDHKVVSRTVEVGQPYEDFWVISSGLDQGEKVIVEGLQKVRPGRVVDPVSAPAAQSPPST